MDNGSRVNIIFKEVLEMMKILDSINKSMTTLPTFNGSLVQSLKIVKLVVHAKSYNYLVVFHDMDCLTLHNTILGQNWLYKMRAVHRSTITTLIGGIKEIKGDQAAA